MNTGTHRNVSAGVTTVALEHSARDHAAITETIEAIGRGADLHQWEAVRAAFAEHVELDYGTPEQLGPDGIVSRWQPFLEGFDATQHVIDDLRIEVDGDRATATSRFLATHVLRGAGGGDVWTLAGRYEHSLIRGATGWTVTRMRMIPGESTGNVALLDHARAKADARAGANSESGGRGRRDRNRETVRAFFRQLEAMDTGERFVALFTEDARQMMPFSPEGFPRLLDGRAAIRNQYMGLPAAYTHMRFPGLTVHDMASPSEFFVQYRGDIGLKSGGRYENDYAGHFILRDGRIAEFREYFNPIVLQEALGGNLQQTFNVK